MPGSSPARTSPRRRRASSRARSAIAPANPPLLALLETATTSRQGAAHRRSGRGRLRNAVQLGTAINRDGAESFAALYLEMARVLAPDNAQIYFELGGIAERLAIPERAIAYYDKVPADSPFPASRICRRA
jgi:hypothetical protein